MITITDPSQMIWHPFPLPDPLTVNPDTPILVLNWETNSKPQLVMLTAPDKDWRDEEGRTFCIYNTTDEHYWCWHKRFTPEERNQ